MICLMVVEHDAQDRYDCIPFFGRIPRDITIQTSDSMQLLAYVWMEQTTDQLFIRIFKNHTNSYGK